MFIDVRCVEMIGRMGVVLGQTGIKWTSSNPPSSTKCLKIKYGLAAAADKGSEDVAYDKRFVIETMYFAVVFVKTRPVFYG
jgi:hypothetical protein